jgi:hypothetical protein
MEEEERGRGSKKRKIDDDGFAAFLLFFRFLCPLFQLWCICPLQQALRSSASMEPEQEKEREMGNESAKESSLSCKRKVFFLSDRRAREWRLSIFFSCSLSSLFTPLSLQR